MTKPTFHSVEQIAFASAVAGVRSASVTVPSLTSGGVVVVPIWADGATRSITSVFLDAVELDPIASTFVCVTNDSASSPGIEAYGLAAPVTGAHTLSIGTSDATLLTGAFVLYFEGVTPTSSFGGGVTASNATPNAAPALAVTSTSDQLPIGICGAYDVFNDLAGGQTAIGTKITDGIFSGCGWVAQTSASASPTFTWALTAFSSGGNVQSGFVVNGITGGGGGSTGRRVSIIG